MRNIQISIIAPIFLFISLNAFAGDPMHASNAVDAYANLIDTESISKTIKTEDEWNRLIQSYIDRFGYEFVIEAVRNYRGREDLKKGEKYA